MLEENCVLRSELRNQQSRFEVNPEPVNAYGKGYTYK